MEYRVVWKREGGKVRRREFKTHRGAARYLALLGPEPWTAYGQKPDDECGGRGSRCYCGGYGRPKRTIRECNEDRRADMPTLEYVRLECREVGAWGVPVGVDA